MLANQEAQRVIPNRRIFRTTRNSVPHVFYKYMAKIDDNKKEKKPIYEGLPPELKQISMDSIVASDVTLGDKC